MKSSLNSKSRTKMHGPKNLTRPNKKSKIKNVVKSKRSAGRIRLVAELSKIKMLRVRD